MNRTYDSLTTFDTETDDIYTQMNTKSYGAKYESTLTTFDTLDTPSIGFGKVPRRQSPVYADSLTTFDTPSIGFGKVPRRQSPAYTNSLTTFDTYEYPKLSTGFGYKNTMPTLTESLTTFDTYVPPPKSSAPSMSPLTTFDSTFTSHVGL